MTIMNPNHNVNEISLVVINATHLCLAVQTFKQDHHIMYTHTHTHTHTHIPDSAVPSQYLNWFSYHVLILNIIDYNMAAWF